MAEVAGAYGRAVGQTRSRLPCEPRVQNGLDLIAIGKTSASLLGTLRRLLSDWKQRIVAAHEVLQELFQGARPPVVGHQPDPDSCLNRIHLTDETSRWNLTRWLYANSNESIAYSVPPIFGGCIGIQYEPHRSPGTAHHCCLHSFKQCISPASRLVSTVVRVPDVDRDSLAVYAMSHQQMTDCVDVVFAFDAKNGRFSMWHRSAELDLLFHGGRDLLAGEAYGLLQRRVHLL